MPILRLRKIERTFEDAGTVAAIRDVSLDVYAGEFVCIMGASGAGKSTLLNLVGLLDVPSAGEYSILGENSEAFSAAERDIFRSETFGFIFQASHVLPFETVAHNAALGLSIQQVPRKEQVRRVHDVLEQVGLLEHANKLAGTLSGGERQRLAIARAVATRPRVLLADEPTGNLDSANTDAIMRLMVELNSKGATVVMITHDQHVASFADRILVMSDGVLEAGSDQSDGVEHPDSEEAAVAAPPIAHNPSKRSWLRGASTAVTDAISSLTSRPTRTIALVCAFLLGTGGLVAATGLSATASQQIATRLAAGALDQVNVFDPAGMSLAARHHRIDQILKLKFVQQAGEHVDVAGDLAQISRFEPGFELDPDVFSGQTIGADPTYLRIMKTTVWPNQALDAFDRQTSGHVALVGSKAAVDLHIPVGSQDVQIWALGRPYTVIGIIKDSQGLPSLTSTVVLPERELPTELPATIVVRTVVGYPAAVAEAIPYQLAPGAPGKIQIATVGDLRNLRVGVSDDLGSLVAAVAAVLLVMAILSAGTAMYLSVQSRTQEIALRRALGQSRAETMLKFLLEGTAVGVAGGLVGVAIGMTAVVLDALAHGWTSVLPWQAVVVGLLAGLIGGALSAVLPAYVATKIEPATAIR
jgi:macrolide transport system ATP-binding/permease protein